MSMLCRTLGVLALTLTSVTSAFAETLIQIQDLYPDDLKMVGFELTKAGKIEVDAVGIQLRRSDAMPAYAWILNTRTRQPIWSMEREQTSRVDGERLLQQAQVTLDLDPGQYELYYYAGSRWNWSSDRRSFSGLGDVRRWLHGDWHDDHRELESALEDCYVKLSSKELSTADVKEFEPTGEIEDALLRFTRLGDRESIHTAFKLGKDAALRIYSIIEFPEDWRHPVDHGWIVNARTRERVWEMDHHNTQEAGGAEKNRMFDDEIRLAAGEYELFFGTDDSHSFEEFNAAPPHDPLNWGITVLPVSSGTRGDFREIPTPDRGDALIDMTRVRDGEFMEQPFRLKRDGKLQVYAIGEFSWSDREFADYAWIQKAGSDEIVWEMNRRNTHHAGGADKNRLFDGIVELPKGDYVAFYTTDGSHSYRRWNADAPFDQRGWGLVIHAAEGTKTKDFERLSEADMKKDGKILSSLVRVGDRAHRRDHFTLDKPTRVRIYALGEGDDGRMYDYGYIINEDTDEVVWEMTYRRTRHAGGARKNRVVEQEITLEAGRYEVVYETDGSHSFPDWNATRPRDARSWGITISMAR